MLAFLFFKWIWVYTPGLGLVCWLIKMDNKFPMSAVKLKEASIRYLLKFDQKNKSYSRHCELSQEIQSFGVRRKLPSVISSACIIKGEILRKMPQNCRQNPSRPSAYAMCLTWCIWRTVSPLSHSESSWRPLIAKM